MSYAPPAYHYPLCPRCGGRLSPAAFGYWCGLCRVYYYQPRHGPRKGLISALRELEARLRSRLQGILAGWRGFKAPSRGPPVASCPYCGSWNPPPANYCSMCGSLLNPLMATRPGQDAYASSVPISDLEERVYDYIAKHGGAISISKACDDLGITREALQRSIERLKEAGRISD